MQISMGFGNLYIVATPIGNLGDISERAIQTLKKVDAVIAEDTRHTLRLLNHFGIEKPILMLHDHNERDMSDKLLERLQKGENFALVSDAGTPLIRDPGYRLCRGAHSRQIKVTPIPGASAIITALSIGAIPCDRFVFEGFLSAKPNSRLNQLETLAQEERSMVFYEAPHRLLSSLEDMVSVFGEERLAMVARELTKKFETYKQDSLLALKNWVQFDPEQQQGEIVIIVAGLKKEQTQLSELNAETEMQLRVLMKELPIKQACRLVSEMTGIRKNILYEFALKMPKN
ncbi:MAG: 16S rRNA (cytidine(1402)-2'-O)-methyltransferase [Gammaproteobacteria bacterium]